MFLMAAFRAGAAAHVPALLQVRSGLARAAATVAGGPSAAAATEGRPARGTAAGFATSASRASPAAATGSSGGGSAPQGPALRPASIWCIGRNYAEHAKELGNEVPSAQGDPMIFLKAGASAVPPGELPLPPWSSDIHPELELAIEFGPDLRPARSAVALDLTARDVQAGLKKKQWPWTLAKSFKASAALGTPFSLEGVDLASLVLTLDVNGERRQTGRTGDMIYSLQRQVLYVTERFPVSPGDVLLTGTPPGVAATRPGDELVARVLGRGGAVLSEGRWRVVVGP